MTDRFTKAQRSYIMSRIKGKGTRVELAVKGMLGGHFTFQPKGILGNPDFAHKKKKIAIFVDGDFWHGKEFGLRRKRLPKYWIAKITRNIRRDQEVNKKLKDAGWKVVRIWEKRIGREPKLVKRLLRKVINLERK